MANPAFSGYCYGGPVHGENFKFKTNSPFLTIIVGQDRAFCYRLHNIPPGSEAWHWLPANIADADAMDFVIETIMESVSAEPQEPEPEEISVSVHKVQRLRHL